MRRNSDLPVLDQKQTDERALWTAVQLPHVSALLIGFDRRGRGNQSLNVNLLCRSVMAPRRPGRVGRPRRDDRRRRNDG